MARIGVGGDTKHGLRVEDTTFRMSRFAGLKKDLENNGWEISSVELPIDAWWAFEIWQLWSTWRPVGRTLHLTLMVDPLLSYAGRLPGEEDVWSIAIGHGIPTSHLCEGIALEVFTRRKYTERCREILAAANQLRNS